VVHPASFCGKPHQGTGRVNLADAPLSTWKKVRAPKWRWNPPIYDVFHVRIAHEISGTHVGLPIPLASSDNRHMCA
jgi:hypothetical protein